MNSSTPGPERWDCDPIRRVSDSNTTSSLFIHDTFCVFGIVRDLGLFAFLNRDTGKELRISGFAISQAENIPVEGGREYSRLLSRWTEKGQANKKKRKELHSRVGRNYMKVSVFLHLCAFK